MQYQPRAAICRSQSPATASGCREVVVAELSKSQGGSDDRELIAGCRLKTVKQFDTDRSVERRGASHAQPIELGNIGIAPGNLDLHSALRSLCVVSLNVQNPGRRSGRDRSPGIRDASDHVPCALEDTALELEAGGNRECRVDRCATSCLAIDSIVVGQWYPVEPYGVDRLELRKSSVRVDRDAYHVDRKGSLRKRHDEIVESRWSRIGSRKDRRKGTCIRITYFDLCHKSIAGCFADCNSRCVYRFEKVDGQVFDRAVLGGRGPRFETPRGLGVWALGIGGPQDSGLRVVIERRTHVDGPVGILRERQFGSAKGCDGESAPVPSFQGSRVFEVPANGQRAGRYCQRSLVFQIDGRPHPAIGDRDRTTRFVRFEFPEHITLDHRILNPTGWPAQDQIRRVAFQTRIHRKVDETARFGEPRAASQCLIREVLRVLLVCDAPCSERTQHAFRFVLESPGVDPPASRLDRSPIDEPSSTEIGRVIEMEITSVLRGDDPPRWIDQIHCSVGKDVRVSTDGHDVPRESGSFVDHECRVVQASDRVCRSVDQDDSPLYRLQIGQHVDVVEEVVDRVEPQPVVRIHFDGSASDPTVIHEDISGRGVDPQRRRVAGRVEVVERPPENEMATGTLKATCPETDRGRRRGTG